MALVKNDSANSYSGGQFNRKLRLQYTDGATSTVATYTESGVDTTKNLFSFTTSSELFTNILPAKDSDETFDLLYLARAGGQSYDLFVDCFDTNGIPIGFGNVIISVPFPLITE